MSSHALSVSCLLPTSISSSLFRILSLMPGKSYFTGRAKPLSSPLMISTLPISCPDIEGVSGADGIIPISVPHIASFDAFISC